MICYGTVQCADPHTAMLLLVCTRNITSFSTYHRNIGIAILDQISGPFSLIMCLPQWQEPDVAEDGIKTLQ